MDFEKAIAQAIATSIVVGFILPILYLFKWLLKDENKEDAPKDISEYKGLGGWLILVILLLFVRIVNIGQSTILILTAGREYGNNTGEFVFDFLSSFLITVLYAYVIYLFFSRKRKFPKYYILLNIIIVMTYVITFITMVDDPQKDFLGKAAGSVIYAIICGIYVTVSKRVKATFIED